jgi:hypothetical protein
VADCHPSRRLFSFWLRFRRHAVQIKKLPFLGHGVDGKRQFKILLDATVDWGLNRLTPVSSAFWKSLG